MSRNVADLTYTYCSPLSGSMIIGPKCHNCMNKEYNQHSLNDVGVVYVSSPTGLIPFPIRALMFCNGNEAPFTMQSIAENMLVMNCTNCLYQSNAEATADNPQRSTPSVIGASDQSFGSDITVAPRKKKSSANREDVNKNTNTQDKRDLPSLPHKRMKLEEPESHDIFIIENPIANISVSRRADNVSKDANGGPAVPLSLNSAIGIGSESSNISANQVSMSKPVESGLVTTGNATFDVKSNIVVHKEKPKKAIEENNVLMHTSASNKFITVWADSDSTLPVSSDFKPVIDSTNKCISKNIPKQVETKWISASNATVGAECKKVVGVVGKGASNVQDVKNNAAEKTSASGKKKITGTSVNDVPFAFGRKPSEAKDILKKGYVSKLCAQLQGQLKHDILARIIKSYFSNQDTFFCSHCLVNLCLRYGDSFKHFLSVHHISNVYSNGLVFCSSDDLLKFLGVYNGIDSELSGTADSILGAESNKITDKGKSNVFLVNKGPVQQISSSQDNKMSKGVLKGIATNERTGIPVYIEGLPFVKGTPGELTANSFKKIYNSIACLQDLGVLGSNFEEYIIQQNPDAKNITHCFYCGRIDSSVAPGHRYFSHFLSASHIAQVMNNSGVLSRDWNQFMRLLTKFLRTIGEQGRFGTLRRECRKAVKDCKYSSKDSKYKWFEDVALRSIKKNK